MSGKKFLKAKEDEENN